MAEIGQFVGRVGEWQRAAGLNDSAFARFLGRHKSEWSMLRSGERRPSRGFVEAALRRAPEPWRSALEKAYLADLTENAEKVPA